MVVLLVAPLVDNLGVQKAVWKVVMRVALLEYPLAVRWVDSLVDRLDDKRVALRAD